MMKSRKILWNVLVDPEIVETDERLEQIEQNSYYWSYYVLSRLLLLGLILLSNFTGIYQYLGKSDRNVFAYMVLIIFYAIVIIIEIGRFLYSCYHGSQEFCNRAESKAFLAYKGRRKGLGNFLMDAICMGLFALLGSWTHFNLNDWRLWLLVAGGIIFYFLLCHLAYYRYACLVQEEEDTEPVDRRWISSVCGGLLAAYFLFFTVFSAIGYANKLPLRSVKHLPEEEQLYLEEITEGLGRYHALDSYQIEYFYQSSQASDYMGDGIAHCYYWALGEDCYTKVLEYQEDGGRYMEFYRDGLDDWYALDGNSWIPVWNSASGEELHQTEENGELKVPQLQPYNGIMEPDPEDIKYISMEEAADGRRYTVVYQDSVETFTLNEFGVMTAYSRKEDTVDFKEEKSFSLITADKRTVEQEMTEMIQKY